MLTQLKKKNSAKPGHEDIDFSEDEEDEGKFVEEDESNQDYGNELEDEDDEDICNRIQGAGNLSRKRKQEELQKYVEEDKENGGLGVDGYDNCFMPNCTETEEDVILCEGRKWDTRCTRIVNPFCLGLYEPPRGDWLCKKCEKETRVARAKAERERRKMPKWTKVAVTEEKEDEEQQPEE